MADKKLTDNEIIKALECCSKKICKQCPNFSEDIECSEKLINLTLDYIARQLHELQERYEEAQAEIERLKGHQKDGFINLLGNCLVFSKTLKDYNDMRKGLKAEAVKEFAERVKIRFAGTLSCSYGAIKQAIDKIVKEMVGDDNA